MTESLITGVLLIAGGLIAFKLKSNWLGWLLMVVGTAILGISVAGIIAIGGL